jgi:hypothetical protein
MTKKKWEMGEAHHWILVIGSDFWFFPLPFLAKFNLYSLTLSASIARSIFDRRRFMVARLIFRRGLLVGLMAMGLLGLASCLPVPLGDPDKSKVDARFNGVWEWRDGGKIELAIFQAYDEKTYFVDVLTGEVGDGGTVKPVQRDMYKGWLTTVKGETFLTLAPMEAVGALPGSTPAKYLVAKVKIEGDTLTALGIDPEYKKLKDVGTPTALQKMIEENMDEVAMFTKPIMTTKWDADQIGRLEKIREGFREWKKG